jgi:gingipain K
VYFLYNLVNDSRFTVVNGEENGTFIVSTDDNISMKESFADFIEMTMSNFGRMNKYQAADAAREYKNVLPMTFVNSLMMDIYAKSRDNSHCADAYPFCTDEGMYEFPAGVNAGSGETGPDYDCLYTTPNPAWYYMKMSDPGDMDIYMYSTPSVDIDFCCWGPFDDPISPCPNGLTSDKVVSCSYSAQPTEHCMIPASAQTGEYYILVITNYSNQACNINFSKVGGSGSTDCSIIPPTNVDIIGFLITQDGEYLAFAGPDDREYDDLGEYGDHVYCVRPIYPGEMTLPDHNYGWSMGCPVCQGDTGECAPGAPIYAEDLGETDQIKVWWGDENPGPGPGGCEGDEFSVNFESGMPAGWTTIDADGDGDTWMLASTGMGTGYGHNGSSDMIFSRSYDNNFGPLTPDNWLVTPAVTLCEGSTFSFWACAQDANYAAEHFGLAVSENGTDFTMVQEWTMTAKGEGKAGGASRSGRAQGNWYQYTVNLGDYAGEGRKIALRHFNCTDWFYLDVDDIELTVGAKNRDAIVKYNVYRSDDNETYTMIGEVAAVAGQTYYEYIDTPETVGTYYYQVRADYGDCESDPAVSGADPTVNYVTGHMTGMDELDANVNLYPNPTKGNVTIEANGMSRITVVSVLGQVVFDTELDANEYTLNMARFNAGMYMVRIYTENGMTVKRVTVMQ